MDITAEPVKRAPWLADPQMQLEFWIVNLPGCLLTPDYNWQRWWWFDHSFRSAFLPNMIFWPEVIAWRETDLPPTPAHLWEPEDCVCYLLYFIYLCHTLPGGGAWTGAIRGLGGRHTRSWLPACHNTDSIKLGLKNPTFYTFLMFLHRFIIGDCLVGAAQVGKKIWSLHCSSGSVRPRISYVWIG